MATLSYAYADGIVWLTELSPEVHPMVHDMCRLHASTVRVPLGWELRDQWSAAMEAAASGPEQASLELIGA